MRIAWWPGHSTGRYAGSTWYADTFADEIDEQCIAQLNIDSPGCADATAYEEVMWMAEADALCRSSISDALGAAVRSASGRFAPATTRSIRSARPVSTCCSRTFPIEERKQRGYYAVGGCGGNIAWHTPDDVMPVADLEILRRDLAVYVTTIVRVLNAPLHPFDYAAAADGDPRRGRAVPAGGGRRGRSSRVVDDLMALATSCAPGARKPKRGSARPRNATRANAAGSTPCCARSRDCWCRSTTRAASGSITIPRSSSARCRGWRRQVAAVRAGRAEAVHQSGARARGQQGARRLRAARRELKASMESRGSAVAPYGQDAMRAAVQVGYGDLESSVRLGEMPIPDPGPARSSSGSAARR